MLEFAKDDITSLRTTQILSVWTGHCPLNKNFGFSAVYYGMYELYCRPTQEKASRQKKYVIRAKKKVKNTT